MEKEREVQHKEWKGRRRGKEDRRKRRGKRREEEERMKRGRGGIE